ncbi:MAG: zinc ribbon domain-containing protein [Candidatus Heimdallarchaeota archaeon]|nr:zinc ribbon domain-containing protein [Candidatus Heimdallarchaeota archaeon]MCK4610030.1 zinc ribbon domain-containing protein [Candidatus Heimdallarchaeota archaeon]
MMGETELQPETGIKNTTRKHITNSSLIYVLTMMISMFIYLLGSGPAILYVDSALNLLQGLALVWLAYGLFLFHKEEENKIIFFTSIIIGSAAIILLVSNILTIFYSVGVLVSSDHLRLLLSRISGIFYATGLLVSSNPLRLLSVNITYIVSAAAFTFGFYQLKTAVDSYATQRRNIYKGQLSLPLGFALLFIYLTIETIIPQDTYAYYVGEKLVIEEGFQILLWVQYFFSMGNLVMIVLGFWYLRRAFATLDKIPEELFQRIEEAKAQRAEARQQGGGMLGRRGGLFGGFAPPPPAKPVSQTQEPIEEILLDDPALPKKMFCIKCGLELDDDAAFCGDCGEANPYLKKG